MMETNIYHRYVFFFVFLVLLVLSSPVFGAMNFPTAIHVDKAIYFQGSHGTPVQLKPGLYEVAEKDETTIMVSAIGTEPSKPIALQAISAGHEEELSDASADLIPSPNNNPDRQHLLLSMPNGLALEAVGSYSGVFTRSVTTWSSKVVDDESGTSEEPLTLEIEEAIFFKTVGGDPQAVQAGYYEVTRNDQELVLTPTGDTKGEVIHVETESMGTSAAVMMPEFNDNPDLELLMLGTVDGQSLVAIGSHSGAFPRGLWGKLKKVGGKIKKGARKVGGGIKKRVKKVGGGIKRGARFAHGKVGRHIVKHVKTGVRKVGKGARIAGHHIKKHGRTVGKAAYKVGKRVAKETWKYCTGSASGAHTCIKIGMKVAAAAS